VTRKRLTKRASQREVLITVDELIAEENHFPLQESRPDLCDDRRIKRLCQVDTKDFGSGITSHRTYIETEFCCLRNLLIHVSPLDYVSDRLRHFVRTATAIKMLPKATGCPNGIP
jgi:hypothetical protein